MTGPSDDGQARVTVTDADRTTAKAVYAEWNARPNDIVLLIAAALAAERAKARVALAAAIENDENPGLEGAALDAWNAATMRAARIVRAAEEGQ